MDNLLIKEYPMCNVNFLAEKVSEIAGYEVSPQSVRYRATVTLGVIHGTRGRRGRKDEQVYPAGVTMIKPWHLVHKAPD